MHNTYRHNQEDLLKFKLNITITGDISDFDWGIVVGARWSEFRKLLIH